MGRGRAGTGLTAQALRFAGVGAVSTVVHLGLFATLRSPVGSAQWANLLALLLATVANTAMNRRWTFGVRGRSHAARQHAQGLAVLGVTLLMTSGALGLLHAVSGRRADLGRDDGGRARDRVFDAGAVRGDAALDLPAAARLRAG